MKSRIRSTKQWAASGSTDRTLSRAISSRNSTGSQVWRFAELTARGALLILILFWWSAVVAPQLISLSFPSLLQWGDLPFHLNPDNEGSVANAVSAASLLAVALLALANVLLQARKPRNRIAIGGWAVLAVTAALLAWEENQTWDPNQENYDFRGRFVPAAGRFLFGELWSHTSSIDNTLLLSPLMLAFVAAMWLHIRKGLSARAIRTPLTLGVTTWVLVIVYEKGVHNITYRGWTHDVSRLLEETFEFSGALLLALGASIALAGEPASRRLTGVFSGRRMFRLAVASTAMVVVLGGVLLVEGVLSYRAPLLDTRGWAVFNVNLYDHPVEEHSLVQELGELGTLSTPLARVRLRVTNSDPQGHPGVLLWRIIEAGESGDRYDRGGSGNILREGRMDVAARDEPRWENIDFPPLVEAQGRPLAVQLVAEVKPEAYLRIGGTKTEDFKHLQFLINGQETWPNQKLELVAYGPSDLTRSKLQAIGSHFRWSWPVLAGAALFGLSLIIFIPVLLITAALPGRGLRE